ncbi:methyltransferase domain-containing protein [Massilia sp. G4R7]|uniref:Methyltransferase domain-containing protein n=1 Tax=Massilia phyllostachyos TaxID=2898585 RepID=A0ABS8Q9B1_9BURK|nr:methyltransferase domain-containing protein [Massilia phyllostachyos]MCD2517642.1 methyltransferase domain-containing protein [Massilia phyllostachyos]
MDSTPNPFDQGGQAYARFRPEYPRQLAAFLASVAPERRLAVDVGCGNGQLTRLLAPYFDQVVGLDPSADQIAHAVPQDGVEYRCAPAECLPLPDGGANLITAAQAAHWFDLPAFYAEARRIAAPGAILALISYGVMRLEPALDARFHAFYRDEIGPFWPAERKLVDSGYATIDFPFEELEQPALEIRLAWDLPAFLGYLSTWSAVRGAREAGREAILLDYADDARAAWGDPARKRTVSWPINMRIGRLGKATAPGTEGYAEAAEWLIPRFESVAFEEKYRAVLYLLPIEPGRVLDIGAGTGADAAWFAAHGHAVTAVEPVAALRKAGRELHPSSGIEWIDDSLPALARLAERTEAYDLAVMSAVWQHLDAAERAAAMAAILPLLKPGAVLVMSIRHGPPPPGHRSFDVSPEQTIGLAAAQHAHLLMAAQLPSVQAPHRDVGVTWSWLVFQKNDSDSPGMCLRP